MHLNIDVITTRANKFLRVQQPEFIYIHKLLHSLSVGSRKFLRRNNEACLYKMEDRIVINVSGMTFETKEGTLLRFPDTLLGNPTRRKQYYNPVVQEYFFNRHRVAFESILFYYQSGGRLLWPEDIPASIFTEEVEFFQLGEQALNSVAKCLNQDRRKQNVSPQWSFKNRVWNLFEHPDTSNFARIIAMFSILMITTSVIVSCLETLPGFRGARECDVDLRCNETAAKKDSENATLACDKTQLSGELDNCTYKTLEVFIILDTICYSWFLFEYLVRFAMAPNRFQFLISPLNIVDLLAILPFFTIIIGGNRRLVSLTVLRIARLLRIFRILKLTRYSRGLKVMMFTVRASLSELEMMMLFMFMIIILSSSAVFYTDLGVDGSHFSSIPDAFWWSLTTVSTVGYGDYYPITSFGKVVGGICAVFGVLAFSLPVMAFAKNFNAYLKGEPIRKHMENKSRRSPKRITSDLSG